MLLKMDKIGLPAILLVFLLTGCGVGRTTAEAVPQDQMSATPITAGSFSGGPSVAPLTLHATSTTVNLSGTTEVWATGGVPPYAYSDLSGQGSVSSSGIFYAPSSAADVTLAVSDSVGNSSEINVAIIDNSNSHMVVAPSAGSIAMGGQVTFSVSGGTAPYIYTLLAGAGTLSVSGSSTATSTVYTSAAADVTTVEIEVSDSSSPPKVEFGSAFLTAPCSTSPVLLLSAQYSGSKSITSYNSPFGGQCFYSANPDTNDTVTCLGLAIPNITSMYYTCSGGKIYNIGMNGAFYPGNYAGLGNGYCPVNYQSPTLSVGGAVTSLQIDARSGGQVAIYGMQTCN